MRTFFILAIFTFIALQPLSAQNYSVQDLQVLEQQNAYEEFIKHARDVRPTERTTEWQSMLSHMVQKKIQDSIAQSKFSHKDLLQLEQLTQWPELKNDEVVQLFRGEYILEYLRNCLNSPSFNPTQCQGQISYIWQNTALKRKLARFGVVLHKLISEKAPAYALHEFLTYGLLSENNADHFCQQEHVRTSVFRYFEGWLSQNSGNHKKLRNQLHEVMSPLCWSSFSQFLRNDFIKFTAVQKEIAYWLLSTSMDEKGELSVQETDYFLSLYFFSGPVVGEVFNLAWNRVKALGENFNRRNQVVIKLLQLDPLPDEIFRLQDSERSKILTRHALQYFPEYIKSYLEICLTYYEGTKVFANGNPTLGCQKLYHLSKQEGLEKLFPASLQYQKLGTVLQSLNLYKNP